MLPPLSFFLAALSKRAIVGVQGNAHPSGFPNLLRYHPSPQPPFSVRYLVARPSAGSRTQSREVGLYGNELYRS